MFRFFIFNFAVLWLIPHDEPTFEPAQLNFFVIFKIWGKDLQGVDEIYYFLPLCRDSFDVVENVECAYEEK